MEVHVYDEALSEDPLLEVLTVHDTLESLLDAVEIVSVHVPLTSANHHLFDQATFARMRGGSYFVNVSRGGLVDYHALGDALALGKLRGAALDVLPVEPPQTDDPAFAFPNTILTPHSAWYSPMAVRKLFQSAAKGVDAVLRGHVPDNVIRTPRVVNLVDDTE